MALAASSFGLYLGNTSSCLAIYKDENVDVVANHAGDRVTAAVIAFHEAEQIIGAAAKSGLFRNSAITVLNNKRLMNKQIDESELETAIKNSSVPIITETELQYSITVGDKIEKITPKKISSLLSGAMYDISTTAAHDDEEHNVVLCVPHRFNTESIQDWSESAASAGFKVLQVIAEPVASCLAHGLGKNKKESELVLVYRVGGVSSDVTLVKVSGGSFTIQSTKYYPELGGHKLTDLLTSYLAEEFYNKYKIDPTESRRSVSKLKIEAERCKHVLSTMSTAHLFVESLCEGVDFSHNITRARFENLISPHISDYIQPLQDILNSTSHTIMDIRKIILCGGTMKIPKLQEKIASLFPCGEVLTSRWRPDETMAIGAAMHSSLLLSQGIHDRDLNSTHVELCALSRPICLKFEDITTLVIPDDTIIPIKIQTIVELPELIDNKIQVKIFEGVENGNEITNQLGLISLNLKKPGKLKVDTDLTEAFLNVHITELSTGKKSSIRFEIHKDDSL
ncbi:heat shock 70 kDa protein 14 [Fopius arisanus]|uniref:Heat shock 70 kDa protein 14 n=1 Tax=Fopius arisanus TaxID=64838 RepID=A0A0C9RY66_9HYME|nr:PREDICTED: heat shock 70 kDa protein 14 [Fopius arisanus]